MSENVRNFDWSKTPLGPLQGWPTSLRIPVDTLLASKFPAALVWGPDLTFIYNDGYEPLLGAKPEPLGKRLDVIWSEVWEDIGAFVFRAYSGQATFIENFPLQVNRYGELEQAYFTFCYSPVRNESGAVAGFLVTVVETTDTIIAQQELREQAANFERLVVERTTDRNRFWQLSSDIMLVTRKDLVVTAANPAWTQVLGWEIEKMVGAQILDFIHPDDHAGVGEAIEAMERGERANNIDSRLADKNGDYHWISWSAVPDEASYFAVGRDVTLDRERALALRQAEDLLRHSQKMDAVGQLTGGLAHDFNNLLGGIVGSLDMLRHRLEQGRIGELSRYIDAAQSAASRASNLTHRLLAFSRKQTLDPSTTDVDQLIHGMESLIRQTLGPHITLAIDVEPGLWTALIDANQLESTLLNLCINARDAMPEGGQVSVCARNYNHVRQSFHEEELHPGKYLSLKITDTGCGMPADVVERAFEPFFTTKPLGQGTGLGLSMVYGFARQSGGRVHIESTVGHGTSVQLYLPRHQVAQPAVADEPPDTVESLVGAGDGILLIDDESTLRMLFKEMLSEQGFQVMEVPDGHAGLAVLQSDAPVDLLITDIGLPGGLNGRQVADAARALRPGLKVLFITGFAEQSVTDRKGLEPGMQVLTKPFSLEELTRCVRAMLN
ncbi:hybrid sensor histidine kinase/response regulator [Pseudomonas akapageensis]|uniref:hybrid sensor histidine kinase/response regulator n=1 Tax=Pseudomonas akapageensis TaxID=2609961 RepID=UPI001408B420|nr:PAS domain-containing sensor histidine kinase [Pseudomonas akapageensis]